MGREELTIVTGLFDLKRGNLKEGFRRGYEHYIECFKRFLNINLPMVIYIDKEDEHIVWEIRNSNNTRVINKTLDDIREFPFYKKVQEIRNNEDWKNFAGWLPDSPQSSLELYNPLVMSKQFFLNDAAIFDFFDTKYFLWLDAGISNTIGDPTNHINESFADKVIQDMNKMLYVCFPYDGKHEVHGFKKDKMNELAGAETEYVCRGGIFGGRKDVIQRINEIYYSLLSETLNNGYMGTEESIFTILSYQHPDLCNKKFIDSNGLIVKYLNEVNNREIKVSKNGSKESLAIYSLTYNSPRQFESWVESFKKAYPSEYSKSKKYVINNTTKKKHEKEYKKLFDEHGFEEFKFDNIGICGGRQFAAEHFDESNHDFMIFFEDDMLLHHNKKSICKNGFVNYYGDKGLDIAMDILNDTGGDYLKLSFSEIFGDNRINWAWHNLPEEKRKRYFPDSNKDYDYRSTKINYISQIRGIPFAVGEFHYCNWPLIFTKEGNRKIFIETKFEHKYEQTWMSHVYDLIKDKKVKPVCLLASLINHKRFDFYDVRKENEYN